MTDKNHPHWRDSPWIQDFFRRYPNHEEFIERENIQKWVDELIFGNHRQVKGNLHLNGAHCAMGVSVLAYEKSSNKVLNGGNLGTPWPVLDWLGIDRDVENLVTLLNDRFELTLPEIGAILRDLLLKEE